MKHRIVAAMAMLVLLMSAGTVTADEHYHGGYGGYRGHGYHDGGHRDDHGHGGARFYFGVSPYWSPYWYPYPYAYPPYYYYPPYYSYSPPVVVTPPATTYVQPEQPQPQSYWYYCSSPKGYYPYVKECPQGWMKVVPQQPE